jgi:hypothetical protein
LFTTEAQLPRAAHELAVDWPAKLNEHCGLKLVAWGSCALQRQYVAIHKKYDFRTRATAAKTA